MNKLTFILLLVLLSLIFGYPHIIGIFKNRPYVSTVVVGVHSYSFDENHYASRIQKIIKTGKIVPDIFAYEYSNSPLIFPLASTFFLSLLARVLGSVQNLFVFADFVFAPIVFISVYLLFTKFIEDRIVCLIGSLYIIFENQIYPFLTKTIEAISKLDFAPIRNFFLEPYVPFFYSRLENPELNGIFFFLGLFFLTSIVMNSKRIRNYIFFTLISVYLIYSYPFYAIFLLVIFLIVFLDSFFEKKDFSYKLVSGVIIFLGSSFYLLQSYLFYQIPYSNELSVRWGREEGVSPIPLSAIVITLIMFILSLRERRKVEKTKLILLTLFVSSSILSVFLFPVQTDHFLTRVLVPVLRLAEFYLISLFFLNKKVVNSKFIFWGKSVVVAFMLILVSCYSVRYANNTYKYFSLPLPIMESYTWLKNYTNSDDVVLSYSVETNFQLPAMSGVYTFLPYGMFTFMPNQEIEDRIILAYKSVNASDYSLIRLLSVPDHQMRIWKPSKDELERQGGYIYFTKTVEKKNLGNGFNDLEMKDFLDKYHKSVNLSLTDLKKKYKVDYLYWGPWEKKNFQITDQRLIKVFENSEVTIYKL